MTDYGRVVQFGVFPEPVAARLDEIHTVVGSLTGMGWTWSGFVAWRGVGGAGRAVSAVEQSLSDAELT